MSSSDDNCLTHGASTRSIETIFKRMEFFWSCPRIVSPLASRGLGCPHGAIRRDSSNAALTSEESETGVQGRARKSSSGSVGAGIKHSTAFAFSTFPGIPAML